MLESKPWGYIKPWTTTKSLKHVEQSIPQLKPEVLRPTEPEQRDPVPRFDCVSSSDLWPAKRCNKWAYVPNATAYDGGRANGISLSRAQY
jgi:hypothetical protein